VLFEKQKHGYFDHVFDRPSSIGVDLGHQTVDVLLYHIVRLDWLEAAVWGD